MTDPRPEDGASEEQRRLAAEAAFRAERIRILSEELRAARAALVRARQDADRSRRQLRSLRRRRSVRLAIAVSNRARPLVQLARRARSLLRRIRSGRIRPTRLMPQKRLRATPAEEAAFRARLTASLHPSRHTGGPLVSAIVVSRNGLHHLQTLFPALDGLTYRDLEVVLVDNGSSDGSVDYARTVGTRYPIHVVRNAENRSFGDANNQGVAAARGELLLLINNDVAPAGPHVVGWMVDRLLDDQGVVAVASRLIYPQREGPEKGAATQPADLELQHRGIAFVTRDGLPVARNLGTGEDPFSPEAERRREVQAATAASLLIRRDAFERAEGFTIGYDYGTEDVDLCVKLRAAGGRIVYEPQATFWHNESATQHLESAESRAIRQRMNRERFLDLFGPRVFREVFLDRLAGGGSWGAGGLHVGITLTRDDPEAGWGDWYTAHELGDALVAIGWQVSYLERWQDRWYGPDPSVDVVVSLLDSFDVRRLPDGVVTVAWVRNWTDRWLARPWFDEFDLVLASSRRSKELIDERSAHLATLMPLATNPERFRPPDASGAPAVDVVFTGNHWGEDRGVVWVLRELAASGRTVALYGSGWEKLPEAAGIARGPLPYPDLPDVYASAGVVLDDTATPTLPYGAVNSRVFDALASGTLVVTDNVIGAQELFGDLLPAGATAEERTAVAERLLADPDDRRRRAEGLRSIVLERHTYARRAEQLRDLLRDWVQARRIDIAIGPPNWEVAETWGDYHFGRALQRALQRRGHPARIRLRSDWDAAAGSLPDVAIQLFGLAPRRTRPGQLSAVWIISHPELVADELLEANELVFVASDTFADRLTTRTGREVAALHQATDPDRFRPVEGGPSHELLFVANSRRVRRRIVDELTSVDPGLDFAVYGRNWTPDLLDPRYLRGEHVPNHELAAYYAAATIVLNDHWPDMVEHGFISNRLYDAAAAGAFVISDRVTGIDEEFDGGIVTFDTGSELRELIRRFAADPEARARHAAQARAAVLARHTFGHRADEIVRRVGAAIADRPARVLADAADARAPATADATAVAVAAPGPALGPNERDGRDPCRACGRDPGPETVRIREMMFGLREEFEYRRCASCGSLSILEVPDDLERHYPSTYYANTDRYGGPRRYPRWREAGIRSLVAERAFGADHPMLPLVRRIIDLPEEYEDVRGLIEGGRLRSFDDPILDVGCGAVPSRLVVLRMLGFRRLLGIEPFIDQDFVYSGVPVQKGYLADVEGTFRLIMFHHSLEHIPDPLAALRQAADRLEPDGLCLVRTPIADSALWRQYGTDWVELDAPRHVVVLSRHGLERLAARAGFEIVGLHWESGDWEFIASEQYRKDIALHDSASWFENGEHGFDAEQLHGFHVEAQRLVETGEAGRAAVWLRAVGGSGRDA